LIFKCQDDKEYVFYNNDIALYFLTFAIFNEKDILIWCVNTEYDLVNLSYKYSYMIEWFYNKSRFIMGKCIFNNKIKFYDLINFYSLSAEKVGQLFGLKKLQYDFNKRKFNKDGNVIVTKSEIKYCIRDAKIACKAGVFITKKFENFKIRKTATIASTALQIYLKNFAPIDFSQYKENRYEIDINNIYKCYYGGRVEAFFIGKKRDNIKYVDFNSLYPYVMKNFLYPNPFSSVYRGKSIDIENGIVCCKVKVKTNTYLPVLPLRYDKKLLFPVGEFTGYWIIQELNTALNEGQVEIKEIYWSYEYSEVIDLFSDYVNYFYDKRIKSKNKADSYMYKVLMNSLYGKFAEKRRLTKYVNLDQADVFDPIVHRYAQQTEVYIPYSNNVILSAYVTSYGRILLYNAMKKVLKNDCQLLYCDTDSIIYKGDYNFPISNRLGELKIEHYVKMVEIRGAKYYMFIDNNDNEFFICKGIPKYLQADMFTHRKVSYRKPIRLLESKRRHLKPNIWIDFEKRDLTKYLKRCIIKDGNTKPILIRES
jgi:hypothetical protein